MEEEEEDEGSWPEQDNKDRQRTKERIAVGIKENILLWWVYLLLVKASHLGWKVGHPKGLWHARGSTGKATG